MLSFDLCHLRERVNANWFGQILLGVFDPRVEVRRLLCKWDKLGRDRPDPRGIAGVASVAGVADVADVAGVAGVRLVGRDQKHLPRRLRHER